MVNATLILDWYAEVAQESLKQAHEAHPHVQTEDLHSPLLRDQWLRLLALPLVRTC